MRRAYLHTGLFLLAVAAALAAPARADETYDPAAEFALAGNPNGVWTYGRRASAAARNLTLSEGDIVNESNVALLHYENGAWIDITTSLDTEANRVCGQATSLSPFAIVEVQYSFGGILQPVNIDGSSVFKQGRAIPLKSQLFDPGGAVAPDVVATLRVFHLTTTVTGTVEEEIDPASVGAANDDDLFRFDESKQQYVYNLSTDGFATGTYRLEFRLDDGSTHTAQLSLR